MNIKNIVDDSGTTQAAARKMLKNLYDQGFDRNSEELALVLGRPTEEIEGLLNNQELIDDDLAMKMRGIALERSVEIE